MFKYRYYTYVGCGKLGPAARRGVCCRRQQSRAARHLRSAPPIAASTVVAPRIVLEQIMWSDQKHSKCVLGCGSKHEYLVPVGPDGEYLHPDDGGVMPARMPTTVPPRTL